MPLGLLLYPSVLDRTPSPKSGEGVGERTRADRRLNIAVVQHRDDLCSRRSRIIPDGLEYVIDPELRGSDLGELVLADEPTTLQDQISTLLIELLQLVVDIVQSRWPHRLVSPSRT